MLPKEILKLNKGVAIEVDRVFMEPGLYPKMDKV